MTFERYYREEYLPKHEDPGCFALHAAGPPASALFVAVVVWFQHWWLLALTPAPVYLLGWVGHLWAGNRPAAFRHPIWSFRGYWKMLAALARPRAAAPLLRKAP